MGKLKSRFPLSVSVTQHMLCLHASKMFILLPKFVGSADTNIDFLCFLCDWNSAF
jgi:hypothetical protein